MGYVEERNGGWLPLPRQLNSFGILLKKEKWLSTLAFWCWNTDWFIIRKVACSIWVSYSTIVIGILSLSILQMKKDQK